MIITEIRRLRRTRTGHHHRRVDSGFSMIELLIVILVIGVLAATVLLALSGTNTSAARSACNSDARSVEVAVEAFHDNPGNSAYGNYPNSTSGTPSGNSQLTDPASSDFGGPYLRTWPSSARYTISLGTGGQVLVNGKDYDVTNACTTIS